MRRPFYFIARKTAAISYLFLYTNTYFPNYTRQFPGPGHRLCGLFRSYPNKTPNRSTNWDETATLPLRGASLNHESMYETLALSVRYYLKTPLFRPGGFKFIRVVLLSILSISKTQAQHETDYAIQANVIYRITKYIDWPNGKKSGDFIIGIAGDSPLYDELKSLSLNRMVGNQKIVVLKMSAAASSYNCHLLFIPEDESGSLKRIASLTAGTPVLIISESNGLARKGSCINFTTVDDRLKLEINKNNAEQRSLRIATELLELGIIIK